MNEKAFERSFVATSYLLGRRADLTALLPLPAEDTRRFAERLLSSEQGERAKHLAAGLLPLVVALDARRLT